MIVDSGPLTKRRCREVAQLLLSAKFNPPNQSWLGRDLHNYLGCAVRRVKKIEPNFSAITARLGGLSLEPTHEKFGACCLRRLFGHEHARCSIARSTSVSLGSVVSSAGRSAKGISSVR